MISANDAAPPPDQQIRMPKTGEVVAERLRRQIARGELTIGQRLPPEDELTEVFGIARTTLREALRILESQGLLEIRRGRTGGPVVTMPKIDSLAEGLAVTLQLQGTTAGDLDVAPPAHRTPARRPPRRHAHRRRPRGPAAPRPTAPRSRPTRPTGVAFGAAALGMHETLIECAGNTTLATISALLHSLVAQFYLRAAARTDDEKMQRAVRSYRKLVRLIAAGDAPAAEEHWRKQMTFTIEGWHRNQPIDLFDG